MSTLDSTFLDVEDGTTHMHIGSCAVFEGPAPAYDEIVSLIASKLPSIPRYRQKVRFVPGGIGRPVWVDDAHFDFGYHVRHSALPPPGCEKDLNALMGRLMSHELDRRRPLWEAWVIEGLPEGQWALISKVHHCMVDGVSGTDLITSVLDAVAEAQPPAPDTWEAAPEPSGAMLVLESIGNLAAIPWRQVRDPRLIITSRRVADRVRETFDGLRTVERHLAPQPELSITGSIGPQRRWAAVRTELADVKAIKVAFGGTVNDVVLAVVAGAFRNLLQARNEDPDHAVLRSLVPVSVRAAGDHTANNQVSALLAELPIDVADPIERLASIHEQMQQLKGSGQAELTAALPEIAGLALPFFVTLGLRSAGAIARNHPQRTVNTVTTNVPGPQYPLYAAGREMVAYHPFVPISQGVRIGVAVMSYNGGMSFGVTGDYDTVPDLDLFCRAIEAGIGDLVDQAALVGSRP